MDGDEALTGVMVQRILQGHFYIFFTGQSYNGALNQYLQALMYLVLRLPMDAFTLRLVMVAEAGADCVLVYLVGTRMLETRWHAALAALRLALGPFWNIWVGSRSYGSDYSAALVVALAGLYAALRLGGTRHDSPTWAGIFGLCCGLDVWLGPTGAYLLVPAGVWVLASAVRSRRACLAAVAGFAVGSAPVTAWIAVHGRLFNFGGPQPPTTLAKRWENLSGPIVREWLGVGYGHDAPGWPHPLQSAAVVVLALAWLCAVVARRRGLADLLTLRIARRRPIDVVLLAVPVVAALYISSPNAWGTDNPRYLFVAYPILVLGLAGLVPSRSWVGPVMSLVLVAGLAGTSLTMIADHAAVVGGPNPVDLAGAATYLSAHHERHVYSDYWTGMPLQFVAGGRLTVGVEGSGSTRLPSLRHAVDAAPSFSYVAGSAPVDSLRGTLAALVAHHVSYHLVRFGTIYVFSQLSPALRPWQLGIGTRMPPWARTTG